jgi:hypothetical protein
MLLNRAQAVGMKQPRSIWILAAVWILFGVSLFLEAADDMEGWRCAGTCAWMIAEMTEWKELYYFAFTIPNLLMLFSPVIFFRLVRKGRRSKLINGLAIVCALYVLSFGILNWCTTGFQLGVGYYLWLVAFLLLPLGLRWRAETGQGQESVLNQAARGSVKEAQL